MAKHSNLLIMLVIVGSLLGGCSTSKFEAEVVRFHNLADPVQPQGRSVTIVPAYSEQEGLEFARYAELIGTKMSELGFRPAGSGAADVVAVVDYNAQILPQIADNRDNPVSVGVGVGGGSRNVGVSVGTVFGVGESRPKDRFSRDLMITLRDARSDQVIFEGRVSSQGREGGLTAIMPYLVNALFADFPGPNGKTTIYKQDIER